MKDWLQGARGGALVGVLLGAVFGFAGCGSSSDGGGSSSIRISGTVSAPAAQVARAGGMDLGALARPDPGQPGGGRPGRGPAARPERRRHGRAGG